MEVFQAGGDCVGEKLYCLMYGSYSVDMAMKNSSAIDGTFETGLKNDLSLVVNYLTGNNIERVVSHLDQCAS